MAEYDMFVKHLKRLHRCLHTPTDLGNFMIVNNTTVEIVNKQGFSLSGKVVPAIA